MARKTTQPSVEPRDGIATDYALLAIGVGTAVMALFYLILI
jgi:hypothetical protein